MIAAEQLPDGTRLFLRSARRRVPAGSGRRWIGTLQREGACCTRASSAREPDGRWRCAGCGAWWSVSHSGGQMLAGCSPSPVGVDVQQRVERPAAMRWLGMIVGTLDTSIGHWAVTEAYLKASGMAGRRPASGSLRLPEVLGPQFELGTDAGRWLVLLDDRPAAQTVAAVVLGSGVAHG